MTKPDLFLVTYDEIALKKRNRSAFTSALLDNIAAQTDLQRNRLRNVGGRIHAALEPEHDPQRIADQLGRVFGIRWFAPAGTVKPDYEEIERVAVDYARERYREGARTFKLEAKRRDKRFELSSYEICCKVGDAVRADMPEFAARLDAPEAIVNIEVSSDHALVYGRKVQGYGGLPVGATGRAMVLLSGGIDSPVAAWQLMRRGLEVECIYFASPPFTGSRAEQKARDLVSTLSAYSPKPIPLHISHFTEVQETIAEQVPQQFWTVLHRRFMHRIASRLAEQRGCNALATGDSIGQVASQTLGNMSAIDRATEDLVLRPLLGMDKQEIVQVAREIGTYNVSIRPFEDCCVLFAPKRPATSAPFDIVVEQEGALDTEALVSHAVEWTETHTTAKVAAN